MDVLEQAVWVLVANGRGTDLFTHVAVRIFTPPPLMSFTTSHSTPWKLVSRTRSTCYGSKY